MHAIEACRTAGNLGGTQTSARSAATQGYPTTPAGTGTARSASSSRKRSGSRHGGKSFSPIQYFHVVFTLPQELNPLALRNRELIYTILFKAASETLADCARTRLGVQIGSACIFHTWGQNLMDHPHVHCIVTGGGLSAGDVDLLEEEVPLPREGPVTAL